MAANDSTLEVLRTARLALNATVDRIQAAHESRRPYDLWMRQQMADASRLRRIVADLVVAVAAA